MNVAMWVKALQIIPRIDKDEWDRLDVISRWLISTRAAVLIMTFISATIAGILAARDGMFNWPLLAAGSHRPGLRPRAQQPAQRPHRLRPRRGQGQLLPHPVRPAGHSAGADDPPPTAHLCRRHRADRPGRRRLPGLHARLAGAGSAGRWARSSSSSTPGRSSTSAWASWRCIIVWGPLMIGGSYFVITGHWDWSVVLASLPYALGTTTVIFGKHIDKLEADKAKGIHTLPVIIGDKAARASIQVMIVLMYLLVIGLVISGYFSPFMLIVLGALTLFPATWKMLSQPRPSEPPAEYKEGWPLVVRRRGLRPQPPLRVALPPRLDPGRGLPPDRTLRSNAQNRRQQHLLIGWLLRRQKSKSRCALRLFPRRLLW